MANKGRKQIVCFSACLFVSVCPSISNLFVDQKVSTSGISLLFSAVLMFTLSLHSALVCSVCIHSNNLAGVSL